MVSNDRFSYVGLFVNLTMLNIIAVYSLSLSVIIFKIITKNRKISFKLVFQGQKPTTACLIRMKISGQKDFNLVALNALVSEL